MLIDDFNRGPAGNLGANWTASWSGAGGAATPDINAGGQAVPHAAGGYDSAYYNAASFGLDCHVGLHVASLGGSYPLSLFLIPSAAGTSGADGYQLAVTGAGNAIELYREDNAVDVGPLVTWTQALSPNDFLWLALVGADVRAYWGNSNVFETAALIGVFADNTYRSATTRLAFQTGPAGGGSAVEAIYGGTLTGASSMDADRYPKQLLRPRAIA